MGHTVLHLFRFFLLDLFREVRGYVCLVFVGLASGSCLRTHLSLRDLQQMWRDLSGAPGIVGVCHAEFLKGPPHSEGHPSPATKPNNLQ